jgi:hypothetical protein
MRFFFLMGALIGSLIMFYALLGVVAYSQEISGLINPLMISVLKDVVGPVSAGFGGAIAGAYGAYFLQRQSESEKESRADASALHKAIIFFGEMLNELLATKKFFVYPYKDNDCRFIEIPNISPNPGVQEQLDARVIDIFIAMDLAEHISDIKLAGSGYKACFENFSHRNKMMDEYRALLNNSGFQKEIGVSLEEIISVINPSRLIAIYTMTEKTLEILDESIKNLKNATDILTSTFETKFKGHGIRGVRMDFSESSIYMNPMPTPFFDVERLKEYFSRP